MTDLIKQLEAWALEREGTLRRQAAKDMLALLAPVIEAAEKMTASRGEWQLMCNQGDLVRAFADLRAKLEGK